MANETELIYLMLLLVLTLILHIILARQTAKRKDKTTHAGFVVNQLQTSKET